MSTSSIEWTDETWNPVVGCTRVSPGCEHCYAEVMAARQVLMSEAQGRRSVYLRVVDTKRRRWTRDVELLSERLADPLGYKPGTRVFVVSMGDPFHDGVPFEFLEQMWAVMARSPATFQVLTKRPGRMLEFLEWLAARERTVVVGSHALPPIAATLALRQLDALPNVWLGVSVEDQQRADERIPLLLQAPAAVRFLSCEPLLGPVDLGLCGVTCSCRTGCDRHRGKGRWVRLLHGVRPDFAFLPGSGEPVGAGIYRAHSNSHGALSVRRPDGSLLGIKPAEFEFLPQLDWVIVGGESGPKARPMGHTFVPFDPLPGGDLVRSLRDQCGDAGVAFFFKQWGGVNKAKAGRLLDGRTHDAMPEVRRG